MILGINGVISVSRGDSDAQAFITAANITDTTQKNAISQLVTDLKSANIWTKMKAIYPFVGGVISSHVYNLKDPRDLNAAYRITFAGGWTHSSTGIKPNGSNTSANTNLTPNGVLSLNSSHFSYYSRTNVLETSVEVMSTSGDPATIDMYIRFTNGNMLSRIANSTYLQTANASSTGFFLMNRSNSTNLKQYKNGSVLGTSTSLNSSSLPINPILLSSGINSSGTAFGFSTKECAFATIGDSLTDVEVTALYNAVQTFNTTLGRQV